MKSYMDIALMGYFRVSFFKSFWIHNEFHIFQKEITLICFVSSEEEAPEIDETADDLKRQKLKKCKT